MQLKKILLLFGTYKNLPRISRKKPTRCNFVIEFIILKFIEGSTCFERHTAHHQELQTVFAASGLYTHVVAGRCPGWVETGSGISTVSID
jgi:hypothetical protein